VRIKHWVVPHTPPLLPARIFVGVKPGLVVSIAKRILMNVLPVHVLMVPVWMPQMHIPAVVSPDFKVYFVKRILMNVLPTPVKTVVYVMIAPMDFYVPVL